MMEQKSTNILEYVQKLEGMVRVLRNDVRIFRIGSFLVGAVAGAAVGAFVAHLLRI